MNRVLVVSNYKAGRKKAVLNKKTLRKFLYKYSEYFNIVVIFYLENINTSEYDTIIAMGGDGTINKVLPLVVNTEKTLGIIPCGTANLLAAKLGIPTNIKKALDKVVIIDDLPVYKILDNEKLEPKDINIFNINPENEIHENIKDKGNKFNLYKINIKRGMNGISYTNIIFYDNQNKTLPIGQNISTKILVDLSKVDLKLINRTSFKMTEIEDEKDDFSKVNVKTFQVFEYDVMLKEDNHRQDENNKQEEKEIKQDEEEAK